MDPDGGRFISEEEAKAWMQHFAVGETIKVKGDEYEVEAIEERRLILKPLSADERMRRDLFGATQEDEPANRHERRVAAALARKK